MPVVSEGVIEAYLRLTRRDRTWVDTRAAERHLRERSLRPRPFAPPRRLGAAVTLERRREGSWPVYELGPASGPLRGTVIYAHGGGWVNEIVVQHWRLCAQIAAAAGTRVLVPIYPLIPFGTAAEVVAGVAVLAARAMGSGPVCLAGDSAGGQIALSAAMVLRDRHQAAAAQTILISPGLDATLQNPGIAAVEPRDPWLGRAGIRVFTESWRGGLALEDPLVSPLFGDLGGLGPITLYSGTRDILNPDARVLAERAAAAGVSCDFHEQADLLHVYPLLPTAAGRSARQHIVATVRRGVGI